MSAHLRPPHLPPSHLSIVQPHWTTTTMDTRYPSSQAGNHLSSGEFRRGHFVCLPLLNKLNLLPLARDADAVRQIESTQRAFRMHYHWEPLAEGGRGTGRPCRCQFCLTCAVAVRNSFGNFMIAWPAWPGLARIHRTAGCKNVRASHFRPTGSGRPCPTYCINLAKWGGEPLPFLC